MIFKILLIVVFGFFCHLLKLALLNKVIFAFLKLFHDHGWEQELHLLIFWCKWASNILHFDSQPVSGYFIQLIFTKNNGQ